MAKLAAILGGAAFGQVEIPFCDSPDKSMNSHSAGMLSWPKRLTQKTLGFAHGLMLMAVRTQHDTIVEFFSDVRHRYAIRLVVGLV